MTMRRLDRKRLFEAEKLGKTVDVGASPLVKDAIVSATQHREGHKVTTDVVIDLGSSAVDLKTKASTQGVGIGNSSDASYVCKVDQSVFGVVTSVESVCLEAFSDGVDSDIDLTYGTADGSLGVTPGTSTSFPTDVQENIMSVVGKSTLSAFDASELDTDGSSGLYINFVAGDATTTKATAVIDCADVTVGNLVSGITRIRLAKDDGSSIADIVADSALAKSATTANKFGTSDVSVAADLATSLANGIDATTGFDASVTDTTKVTVTVANVTDTSNNENFLVDDPQKASGIAVGDFTGGLDGGRDITSGKLLLRFTGFVAPDDI